MYVVGDEGHYNGRFPWVTALLVVVNVAVFSAQVYLTSAFTLAYALVPGELPVLPDLVEAHQPGVKRQVRVVYDVPAPAPVPQPEMELYRPPPGLTLFTSMFFHIDVFHLIGNMLFLIVFGRNVECAMNHGLFLFFYLTCGVAAGLAHSISDPFSLIPCIGASGAISGIMGAYVSIHPFNNVKVWILIGILEIPALIVIGIWFVLNYLSAMFALEETVNSGGVAYWAHLGGFAAGFVILRTLILCLQGKRLVAGAAPKAAMSPGLAAPDPLANFVSVQAVRKMQSKQE
jgi:membrane associated rhomboid family serine protease